MRIGQPVRVAMYSHDALGLGHLRRNMLIARTLAQSDLNAQVLMITGTSIANRYQPPANVDFLTLPALSKQRDGSYVSRSLGLALPSLISVRAKAIRAAVESFAPDILIVDNIPRGVAAELDETLLYLRAHTQTAVVLGVRDILDDLLTVQSEWLQRDNHGWIKTYFDQVWVYGDSRFFNPITEYNWSSELAAKVCFTGYLDRREDLSSVGDGNALTRALRHIYMCGQRVVLCMVGGGQDGAALADTFSTVVLPAHHYGVILTGPFMPNEAKARLRARLENRREWKVASFHSNPAALLRYTHAAVAMAGYNTVCELLSYETPTLLVPRKVPRQEQWIRAERLRDLGLVELLSPEHVTAERIAQWLLIAKSATRGAREALDFGGLVRLPQLAAALCATPRVRLWA